MSLSDYIKYLRALNGGMTPWEIADGSGVSARDIHLLEVKHKRIGDNDEMLNRLAGFFKVPVEELTNRREAYRKRLTTFLDAGVEQHAPIVLKLEGGEELTGTIKWFAREAIALDTGGNSDGEPVVVQRGWVADWRPADSQAWEVATAASSPAPPAE